MIDTLKKNNTILILGANSGIGLAFTKYFLNNNNVIAISRSTKNLEKLSKENLTIVKADLTEHIPRISEELDIIINCLGIVAFKSFKEVTIEDYKKIVSLNVETPIFTTQKYIKQISTKKSSPALIMQMGSLAGLEPGHGNFTLYSATKMALVGLYNSFIKEYENTNIRFILVAPHAFKSNICRNSIGGDKLQLLFDSNKDLISADEMVIKIMKEVNKHPGNLVPLIINE